MFISNFVAFALSVALSIVANPNKCGDMICPRDKPECCVVTRDSVPTLGCLSGNQCPPSNRVGGGSPASGPKCGDSFNCPVGKICCPNTQFHCVDPDKVHQQCPHK